MQTFWQWLSQLRLCPVDETYFTFDAAQYNALFDAELEKVIARTSDANHRQALEKMRGFGWMSYIASSVRNAGFRDQREVQEKSHDVATKLLMGKLFQGFDERTSGPIDLRFKNSVANAVRNMVELEKNRRHYLPTVPIRQEFQPGAVTPDDLPAKPWTNDDDSMKVVQDFWRLVRRRLGEVGVAVLNARLAGGETKSLVGSPTLGNPGRWGIKRAVQQIKQLNREYAASVGDPGFLRDIERAMEREQETVAKRRTGTTAARQTVGA